MKTKVLICDDDHEMLDMVETILSLYDFEVFKESDSRQFFKAIERNRPDAILLDLWMPIISGQQLLLELKRNKDTADIRVVVFSASREGRMIAELSGADAYLAKPFDMEKLVQLLSGTTEGARTDLPK